MKLPVHYISTFFGSFVFYFNIPKVFVVESNQPFQGFRFVLECKPEVYFCCGSMGGSMGAHEPVSLLPFLR